MQQISKRAEIFFNLTTLQKDLLIPKILGDPYCTTILEILQEIPKSCVEICMDTRIPISTIYRRVQTLHDLGLLQISGSITGDGKKCFLYKSKVKSIEAKFDGKLEVKIKLI
jgi:predicted transcriptional regulator